MGNLTSSLGIGLSGLVASQEAMSVIGHNIANVHTSGYSQQQAMLSTSSSTTYGGLIFGSGVTVTSIQALRDQFLNLQVTQSLSKQASAQTTYNGIQGVSSAFSDDGTTGLNTQISAFFSSLTTLAGNPTSAALNENVVGAAQTMIQELQTSYQTVNGQISTANSQVGSLVPQINTLTSQIAALNTQISQQINPAGDNDAIDQRQALTDQLASLVGIQVSTDTHNNYQITLDSGAATLVSGSTAYQMTTSSGGNGKLSVGVQAGTVSTDVTDKISGGALGADMNLRDNLLPAYQNQLDQIAGSLANQVNKLNMAGYGTDASGASVTGTPFFTGAGIDSSNPPDANFGQVNLANNTLPASASNPPNYKGIINSLEVNPLVVATPTLIASASAAGLAGDNSNALKMSNLQTGLNTVDTNGDGTGDSGPFSTAVSGLVNQVSTDIQKYDTLATNQQNLTSALQTQQSSVSGVDLDSQAAELLQFQQAYQASAQFISTISQLTQTLMSTVAAATS
ncbi:MAG: flagellar hook-associated protein FlgK [Holophaga sp.]|nr:flagellar hook-associated protein FlgK [Holophaga sp.]